MPDQSTVKPKSARVIQRGEIVALTVGDAPANPKAGKTITIQILRAGEFVDMSGKSFDLTTADLDAYIANSSALVASEQVPVELGHPDDPGAPAAAWYRKFFKKIVDGVEWVCAEIELTALGAQSLTDQLYKYFSANLWLDDKVICGGGFVNRPAVGGQQPIGSLAQFLKPKSGNEGGTPMLENKSLLKKAVDLIRNFGEQIAKLEMSHEDRAQRIRKAIVAKYGDPVMDGWGGPYLVSTYDDRVIVGKDDKCFAVPYSFNDKDECALGDAVEVEMTWTPKPAASEAALSQSIPAATVPITNPSPASQAQEHNQGGEPSMTNADLEAKLAAEREAERQRVLTAVGDVNAKLAAAREDERKKVLAEARRLDEIVKLANHLTSGAKQFPYKSDELAAIFANLTDDDRHAIEPILLKIAEVGLVDTGERGALSSGQTAKELPAYAKPHLSAWLTKKGSVAEFFAVNPELGKPEQYDLSEFNANS